jgi:hypothetical protein
MIECGILTVLEKGKIFAQNLLAALNKHLNETRGFKVCRHILN